jgi:hypothetical protein
MISSNTTGSYRTYNTKINSVHEIDLMAGTELRKTDDNTTITRAFGYNKNTKEGYSIVFLAPVLQRRKNMRRTVKCHL